MRKTTTFMLLMLIALAVLVLPATAPAFRIPDHIPRLPEDLHDEVARVLPSNDGDLFVVLRNGLTVMVSRQTTAEVVSCYVFVRAGSILEGKYLTAGLSHYLEHVVSGGTTASFSEEEARERVERLGGATNAFTSYDQTAYYINTSAAHWRDALGLLTSYVSECKLTPNEVEREKAVIQQEFKMGENDPGRVLWKLFAKTAYRVHPVRHPIIGYEGVFVQQSREDLVDYYERLYRPDNVVVSVAGNVDPVEVVRFVVERMKGFERRNAAPEVLPGEPPQLTTRWVEKEMKLARLTQAMIGFPTVRLTHPDLYPLDVLALILGEGKTSRLYRRLKDEERQVLNVGAFNWTPSYVEGQLVVSMDLPDRNWPKVLESLKEEVERVKQEPVSPEELERAKKKVIARHVFGMETASEIARSYGSSCLSTGDPYFDEVYVEGIRGVTAESILRVAKQYLDMDKISVAVVKPATRAEATSGGSAESAEAAVETAEAATTAAESTGAAEEMTTDRGGVEVHTLDNGLTVLIKEVDSNPAVRVFLYGLGGLLLEEDDRAGLASFTAGLIDAGTEDRTKQEIARAIEDVGGSLGTGSQNNTYQIMAKVLKDDLDLALDLVSDLAQNATFPEEELGKERQNTLLAIQRRDENWQMEIMRLFKKNYFKNHPYGHDRLGTEDTVKSFSREDVEKFYRRMVEPSHSVLAVYGDVDGATLLPKIREKFGGWPAHESKLHEWPDETAPLEEDRVVEVKNDKTSAALFVGTEGMSITDPDRPAVYVLDAVLSGIGYPGGRLHEELRGGSADLVYVVHGFPFYGRNGGYFGVISQTTLGNLEKVQSIVLANLERMMDQPLTDKELADAKEMVITMHELGLESLDSQATSAAVNEVLGLGWDYDQHYTDLVRDVTAEDVQRVAHRLFTDKLIVRTIPRNPVEVLPQRPVHSDVHMPN